MAKPPPGLFRLRYRNASITGPTQWGSFVRMALCVSNPAVHLPLSAPSAASAAALRDLAGLPDIDEPDIRGQTLQTSPVVPGPSGDGDNFQLSTLRCRKQPHASPVPWSVHPALPQASAAGSCTGRARARPRKGHRAEQGRRLTRRGRHLAITFPINLQPVPMIIERRKGLTPQPAGPTRDRITQITLRLMRILPKQAGQILFEARVLQLRRRGLQGVRAPLSCRRPVRIGLGNRDVRVSIGPLSVPSQRSPSWRECRLGTLTSFRQRHPMIPTRSGEIPGFFPRIPP